MSDWPSVEAGCIETEDDVMAAEEDTGEPGCPVCGYAPEEHPAFGEEGADA